MSITNAIRISSQPAQIRRQTIAALILTLLLGYPLLTWGQAASQRRGELESRAETNRATIISERGIRLNQAKIDGSIQQNRAEDIDINNSTITGNLFVSGSPQIQSNGNSAYKSTSESFNSQSASYTIRLNNSNLDRIVSGTSPIKLPDIDAPAITAENREDLTINKSTEINKISFRNLRNLTVNANGGEIRLPSGSYGNFVLNSNVTLVLGDADANNPTTYNLQELVLNANSRVKILGKVRLNLVDGITLNANTTVGSNAAALQLNVADGNVVLNSNCQLYAIVQAPQGEVVLNANSLLQGNIICKQLTVNNGRIEATTRRNLEPR
jgi:hypothetical protein